LFLRQRYQDVNLEVLTDTWADADIVSLHRFLERRLAKRNRQ